MRLIGRSWKGYLKSLGNRDKKNDGNWLTARCQMWVDAPEHGSDLVSTMGSGEQSRGEWLVPAISPGGAFWADTHARGSILQTINKVIMVD